jgi:WhiB family redox-sensing transcriptional regulator
MSDLPSPPAWASLAAAGEGAIRLPCQHHDRRWWFSDHPDEIEQAKDHCRHCPMQSPCLVGALGRHEPCGVWGGQLFENGLTIEQKRPRGRPRKHPEGTGAAAKHPRAFVEVGSERRG